MRVFRCKGVRVQGCEGVYSAAVLLLSVLVYVSLFRCVLLSVTVFICSFAHLFICSFVHSFSRCVQNIMHFFTLLFQSVYICALICLMCQSVDLFG